MLADLCTSVFKKVSFPQSRKFSSIKKSFQNQGIFPQWRKFYTIRTFSTVKEIFHGQGNFLNKRFFWMKVLVYTPNWGFLSLTNAVVFLKLFMSSKHKFNLTINNDLKVCSLISSLLSVPLSFCLYFQYHVAWTKSKYMNHINVLFTAAPSLKKAKLWVKLPYNLIAF